MYVFGATSSHRCSNYALKKTPLDYKEVWGSKASDTLRCNFYVDDMLKSIKFEEEEEAVDSAANKGNGQLLPFLCL